MKKETKELFKTIIRNQELIMKALKIEIPINEVVKKESKPAPTKKEVVKKVAVKSVSKK